MKLEKTLDRIHEGAAGNRLLQVFTAFVRVLLGFSFIPPSIPKITGQRFTLLPPTDPVGHYFEALYQTGFYYNFIGWSQLIAVILLLIPRTSHIGALLFLPIILNIAVLTTSVGFRGTWLVTILMSIACLYLVCWDYPRWKKILFGKAGARSVFPARQLAAIPLFFALGGPVFFSFLAIAFGAAAAIRPPVIGLLLGAGFVFGIGVAIHLKFMFIATANDI